ncbi:MAG: hypothetical protein J0L60_05070 [Ignavibacteria bacterium]|nr:hypothetical protein [Ignavibacteria bacterium]
MTKNEQIFDLVEKTLNSLDHMKKLDGNPFLYTRVMENRARKLEIRRPAYRLVPGFGQLLMILIILINCATLIWFFKVNSQNETQKELVRDLKEVFQVEQDRINY